MMGRRQKVKTGDEYDLLGSRRYCYLQRPGVTHLLKRRLSRRFRREQRAELRTES